jgi:hypothetical protein
MAESSICNSQFAIYIFQFPRLARPVAVEVLDRSRVSPGDLINGNAEYGRDLLALGRAGRPASERDGCDSCVVEAAALGEFRKIDVLVTTKIGDGADHSMDNGAGSGEKARIQQLNKELGRFAGRPYLNRWHAQLELYRIWVAPIISIDQI